MASVTNSRSASALMSVVQRIRARIASALSDSLPFSSALASDVAIRFCAFSSASGNASTTMTSQPPLAPISAIPAPMTPQPTTPRRFIVCSLL